MEQINVNTTTKISASSIIKSSRQNSTSTETMVKNISIDILVNNINSDIFKDIEHIQSHTRNKFFLNVDSTTK